MSASSQPLFARLAAGGAAVVWVQALRLLLRLVSMVTLARLLSPLDFGLFGMAALVYGLLQTVRDLGISAAAMQQGNLTPGESRLLLWLQSGAGLLVAALTCALAPLVAAFFAQPVLQSLLYALSVSFLLQGIGGQYRVELGRELRFRTISLIEAGGLVAGITTAIVLAARGHGYWSLAAMILVQEGATMLGLVLTAPVRLAGRTEFSGAGRFLRHGFQLAGFNLVQYAAQMVDQAFVAVRFGSHALGLYGRAWQLGTLPTYGLVAGLTGWMIQGLVKLRDEPEAFRQWCRRVLNALAYACLPLGALLVAAPDLALRGLLGPQWSEAAGMLRWLALTLPLQPWLFAELWILAACRRSRRLLLWSLVRLLALAVALLIFAEAGPVAIAATVTGVQWLLLPVSLWLVGQASPFRPRDLLTASAGPVLLGLLTVSALWLTRPLWVDSADLSAGLMVLGVMAATTAALMAFCPPVRREMITALQLVRGRNG
ncbi:MAG: oligosaccharide flippase family protein [Opitutaceae bacterium]|nr:oligosaccharide flippase family protein [Opitutaceae bacterium]